MAIIPAMTQHSTVESTQTVKMMNQHASKGLRTLMFAQKELDKNLDIAAMKDKDEEELAKEVENDIELLGVTGLEDLLQDNVAKCIKDFRTAQIKVWMLTGDKGETAKTIAISCGLIDKDRLH